MRRSRTLALCLLALTCASISPARSAVRLAAVFGDHMVLQRDRPLPIWGWAAPGQRVHVRLDASHRETTANDRGQWRVSLPAMQAGGPHTLTVAGGDTLVLEDILIGEVWLCSGQSNMEMGLSVTLDGQARVAAANHPGIRLLHIPKRHAPLPQDDVEAHWKPCTPQTVIQGGWGGFSAVAYYFGRRLHDELGVPIGLIQAAWSGTRIEPWTPPAGFAAVPALKDIDNRVQLADPRTQAHKQRLQEALIQFEDWLRQARQALTDSRTPPAMPIYPAKLLPPEDHQSPTSLYNAMIHPLVPMALRGAIWYQGESNHDEGMLYTDKLQALVNGWRTVWSQGDFPFYYVQIAPWPYGAEWPQILPQFWEAQSAAQALIPNSGMAVIHDVGDSTDIHPMDKQSVGRRLALWALARTYGRDDVVYTGPTYRSFEVKGDKMRLHFDHTGGGLATRDGLPPDRFELIDADRGGFVRARARIDGDTVVLQAPGVARPVAVRLGWHKLASPNLMNREGLPVVPFRAGTVPRRDRLALEVPEAAPYKLVYDLDLVDLSAAPAYAVDRSAQVQGPFDRVAYFIELTGPDRWPRYLYVSMDAFTADLGRIAVPTAASGAHFQQPVHNLHIVSNVDGIATGTVPLGHIEFWPTNYGPDNVAAVPGAAADAYDFGDQPVDAGDYGSMQIHNPQAGQTLFAVNHWKQADKADIGIGNRPQSHPDWTFAANAHAYRAKRLRVLVRPK